MLEYVGCRTSKAPGQPPQQINVDRFVRSPECVARIDDMPLNGTVFRHDGGK